MKKLYYLIVLVLILGLVLTGCSLLSNVGQVPTTEQSGIASLTKSDGDLDPTLVGLWHFDGNADDSSVHGNDGIISGATDAGSANAMFGDALSFDGIGYVEVSGSTSMNVSSSYTFEAWINMSGENKGYCGFFRRGDSSTSDSEIEIYTQDFVRDRKLTVAHNRGGDFCYNYFTAFPVDQWIHLVVTWDGISLKAYYNNMVQSVTGTGGISPIVSPAISALAEPNYIGVGYNTVYMNGIIDEVRIWDVALDSTQIAQSYALGTTTLSEVVTVLGEESLADGGVAIFTSSFYVGRLDVGEDFEVNVSARTMIVGSDAVVTDDAERGITPKGAIIEYDILNRTDTGFDITAWRGNKKAKSLHLSMLLGTDEGLGVNVQFLPYD